MSRGKPDSDPVTTAQRRAWRLQRVAWSLMAVLLLAGLLGLLGSGLLSRASAGRAGGPLWVEYERFLRQGAPTRMRIHVRPAAVPASSVTVWLAGTLLDGVQVESVLPPPRQVQASDDRITWGFEVSSGEPLTVRIHLVPAVAGTLETKVGLGAGPSLGFRQWVYP